MQVDWASWITASKCRPLWQSLQARWKVSSKPSQHHFEPGTHGVAEFGTLLRHLPLQVVGRSIDMGDPSSHFPCRLHGFLTLSLDVLQFGFNGSNAFVGGKFVCFLGCDFLACCLQLFLLFNPEQCRPNNGGA